MFGPLRWVLLYVSDLKGMGEFYERVFGLRPKLNVADFIAFDTGACTFELMGNMANGPKQMDDAKGWDRNKVLVSFRVTDINNVVKEIESRGVKSVSGVRAIVVPEGDKTVGWIAQFMDPEGNLMEICEEPDDYV